MRVLVSMVALNSEMLQSTAAEIITNSSQFPPISLAAVVKYVEVQSCQLPSAAREKHVGRK